MATEQITHNLGINILDKDTYDDISSKNLDELYIVKQAEDDTDNAISSRTYADVGRLSIQTQTTEPLSEFTQIWINPDEQEVEVTPASNDLDNLSPIGLENLKSALTPDYSAGIGVSTLANNTFTPTKTGWLYCTIGNSSSFSVRHNNNIGNKLISLTTTSTDTASDNILVEKDVPIYIESRAGSVTVNFYPCKGISNE